MTITKKKIPNFHRQNVHAKRVGEGWRMPRGIDNKLRVGKKGFGPKPAIGYRQDRKIRGLHPSGKLQVIIETVNAVDSVPKGAMATIAGKVGARKRIAIKAAAKAKGIRIS